MLKSVFAAMLVAGAMFAQMTPASANAVMSGMKAAPATAQSNIVAVRGGHHGGGGGKSFGGGGGMRHHGGGGGMKHYGGGGGKHHHHGHHRHWRGSGVYFAAPYYYGGYSYSDCSWLRRKAIRTGKRYWWNRYYECRDY